MTEKVQPFKKLACSGANVTSTNVVLPKGVEIVHVGYGDKNCVMVASDGNVYDYNSQITTKTDSKIKNAIQAACGYSHYLVLTSDGMVYAKGSSSSTGLGSSSSTTEPKMIPFFKENNLKVVEIKAGVSHSWFLCDNGDMYGCGGIGWGLPLSSTNNNVPNKLKGIKVKEMYCNNYAYGIWFKDENDEVWGYADHISGNKKNYSKLDIFKDKQIIKVAPGYQKILILVKGKDDVNEVYFEGSNTNPKLWDALTKENVIDIDFACHHCVMVTKDGRVLGAGSPPSSYGVATLPEIPKSKKWKIACGAWNSVCFPVSSTNSLLYDMEELTKESDFADLKILDRKVHSCILKWRTGKEGPVALEVLQSFSDKHINSFLDWCYLGFTSNLELLQEVWNAFGLQIDPKKTIKDYFLELYRDEDSKDFNILVEENEDEDDDEDDEDEDDDDDEQEKELVEIPVHKFLLQARSGTFREMFSTIKDEKNQVQDFSGIGPESMEIFIKYLYTDIIELTADDIPEFVLPDLQIVPEYFKLNEINNFLEQINELKEKFNVN
ncbi:btk-binding protein-related [Anaeramoeba flamelloides]|uniref:Btk-binding protein-related n=1 Tax=Anaeramoeba flamelloides TaxID=1746091 RepID=A0ABQ8YWK3_9EUKA|nr:btk-binding protein-related [Anaeramoeba flamelloides]